MDGGDWRLNGQERYLRGARFRWATYRPASPTSDQDHCEFCNRKFSALEPARDIARAGWQSEDEYRWVCDGCFADFRERFGFLVFTGTSRRGVELHDARVRAIIERADRLTVDLDAFVHDDRDHERDPGAGRWQRVGLDFHEASSDLRGSEGTVLSAGSLRVNERAYKNVLPIPLRASGSIFATLVGPDFELAVTPRHVRIRLGIPSDWGPRAR
jgi:hypothetical protein